jgi:hypothetical protein
LGSILVRKNRADGSTEIGDALIRPALKRLFGWEGSLLMGQFCDGLVGWFVFVDWLVFGACWFVGLLLGWLVGWLVSSMYLPTLTCPPSRP